LTLVIAEKDTIVMRARPVPLLALMLIGLPGCGDGTGPYMEIARQQAEVAEEVLQVLKTVRDEGSAREARKRLRKLDWRAEEITRQAKDLSSPSQEILTKLEAAWAGRREALANQTTAEIGRIRSLTRGPELLHELGLSPTPAAGQGTSP
jgi:hypothetical protein